LNSAAVRALAALQFKQAIELLKRAQHLVPGDAGIALNLGLACIRAGRFPDAVEPLKLAVTGPDKKDTARFLLGTAYFETRQFQLAAEQLEFVRSHPEFAENALYFLEESYRKSGNGARAEQAFLDLTKLKPDSALVHKLLGTAYDTQGRFPEALAEFQKASLSDPGLPEVRFDAGLLCLKLHDEAAARKWFEAELKLNPCYAAAHYYLGDIDRNASRWAPAAESFRRAIRCAPEYPEAHLALGIALQAQGLDTEALPVLRRAVELAPGTSEAHFHLARALAKAGRTEESRAEWKKAQDLAGSQDVK
jgi:tetratricopeptide (TPR) repeat protein